MSKPAVPHLDLYNFTDATAEDSEYVLTSPRSLQACARHGIKLLFILVLSFDENGKYVFDLQPVELLSQTFKEFMSDNNMNSYNKEVAEVMHKKKEKLRLKKLRLCREERERIIDEKESQKILKQKLLSDESDNDSIESINLNDDEDGDSGYFRPQESSAWNTLQSEREEETATAKKTLKNKPSILSFLDAESSPRVREKPPRTYAEPTSPLRRSFASREQFQVLDGSDDSENDDDIGYVVKAKPIGSARKSASNRSKMSGKSPRPSSVRSASGKKKDFNISVTAVDLPDSIRKNLSLMSEKDKRIMELMMRKAKDEEVQYDIGLSNELNRFHETPSMRSKSANLEKVKRRNDQIGDVLLRKKALEREAQLQRETELNVKNSKWQLEHEKQMNKRKTTQMSKQQKEEERKERQEENRRQLSRERQMWTELAHSETMQMLKEQQTKNKNTSLHDQPRAEKQKRAQHDALMAHIEEKHEHAKEYFHQQMKRKDIKRLQNKVMETERKQNRAKQLEVMQKDEELWQQELRTFQEIGAERATQVVSKRNAMKSLKTQNKRLQKEIDHAVVKSKLEEEEKLRQEELQAIISLKDQRSQMINREKEEYVHASREAARASRAVRDFIKEQNVKSSFDKMAAEAEKVARIEKLGQLSQKKTTPLSFHKGQSTVMLG